MFHVEHYIPSKIIRAAISAGETPEILDAWPTEVGLILFSFSLASYERMVIEK